MYNSATYYIEIFGGHNQNELENIEIEGRKWQDLRDPVRSVLMTATTDSGTQLRTMISGSRVEGQAPATSKVSSSVPRELYWN
jgi:hypothetical protein